jgi:uncharacterized protein (DUF2384 family)
MRPTRPQQAHTANRPAVLAKAVFRAAADLEINQATLAEVLGVSESTVSRLGAGSYSFDETKKKREWEFARLFVRMYRSLVAIVGPGESARQWLLGQNSALGERPIDLIRTTEGMMRVLYYLDAYRGRV